MANKIKPIPSKAIELLEAVVSEFGIETIEDYIKIYKRQQRKRMKKHNTKEEVAYDVYDLMFNEGYSRTRAIERVAIERNLREPTINNHLNNFNQEAKKNNFYTLGWIVDNIYDYYQNHNIYHYEEHQEKDIDKFAKENNLEREILDAYYWRYKTLPKKEKSKYKLDFNNVNIPDEFFHNRTLKKSLISKITLIQEQNNNFSQNENIQIDTDNLPF